MKITKSKLKKIISEQLSKNEVASVTSNQKNIEEVLDIMNKNKALIGLSNLFNKHLGFKPKLKIELEKNRLVIAGTQNLVSYTGSIGKKMFKEIMIDCWGGQLNKEEPTVWFSPHVSYDHLGGGSNGISFIWNALWYNYETNKWIEGRILS